MTAAAIAQPLTRMVAKRCARSASFCADLAISCLGVLVLIAHRPDLTLPAFANLAYFPAVVDGRRPGLERLPADRRPPLRRPPMPASRLRQNAASAAHRAASAAAANTDAVLHFAVSSAPPIRGPTIEPTRADLPRRPADTGWP